ncbi:MAG: AMP-binding protein [Brevundimonas sp.]
MSRVLAAVREAARHTPRRLVVTSGQEPLTCAGLLAAVEALAAELAGDATPVGVLLDNGPHWIIADLALIVAGRPSVPIPPFFTAEQRGHALADAGAALVISPGPQGGIRLDPTGLPPRSLHAGTAKITYTSGSTGAPRGVCLSQAGMESVAASLVEVLGRETAGVHLPVLPLSVLLENVAGLYPVLLAGGRYHAPGLAETGFANPFQPDPARLLATVVESDATSLILVPELLRGLIAARAAGGPATPSLNLVAVGGARVAPALLAAAAAVGLPVIEGYGLSECASVVAMSRPGEVAPGTVGRPLPHLMVSLATDGEILVGPRPFLGYVGGPPAPDTIATGDFGTLDAQGRLSITGRKSNTIITAFGRNIAPEWIESELLADAGILQAMVFGEAQAGLGALIVPMPGLAEPAVAAAVARVNARLPAYAHVRRWRQTPPFDPRTGELTANGRPRRAVLMQVHADFVRDPAPEIRPAPVP